MINNNVFLKITKRISLKNTKIIDIPTINILYSEFYLDKIKVGYIDERSDGSEPKIQFVSKEIKQKLINFLNENNFAKVVYDNNYSFLEHMEDVSLEIQIIEIVNAIMLKKQMEKQEKKIQKDCLSGVFRKTKSGHEGISFRLSLKEIVQKHKGLEYVQKIYDSEKTKLKKGEFILNTNLEELGVKL